MCSAHSKEVLKEEQRFVRFLLLFVSESSSPFCEYSPPCEEFPGSKAEPKGCRIGIFGLVFQPCCSKDKAKAKVHLP